MSFNFHLGSLVGSLNLAINHKKNCIITKKSPLIFLVLTLLQEKHFIKNFILTKNSYLVSLVFIRNQCTIRHIRVVSAPGKRIFISTYKLKSLVTKNPYSFYLVSTVNGVFFANTCLSLNLGGEILLEISC